MDKPTFQVKSRNDHIVIVTGKFKPNGTSAIDNTVNMPSGVGIGFTVARTDVGTYVVTLDDKYPRLIDVRCNRWATAAIVDHEFTLIAETVATDGKFTVVYSVAGAAADIAAHADSWISFTAFLRDSGIAQ